MSCVYNDRNRENWKFSFKKFSFLFEKLGAYIPLEFWKFLISSYVFYIIYVLQKIFKNFMLIGNLYTHVFYFVKLKFLVPSLIKCKYWLNNQSTESVPIANINVCTRKMSSITSMFICFHFPFQWGKWGAWNFQSALSIFITGLFHIPIAFCLLNIWITTGNLNFVFF